MNEDLDFQVIWWNVQRLFAPGLRKVNKSLNLGRKAESRKAYLTKIKNLAAVINDISENKRLGIIGLCEVENSTCVRDLIKALGVSSLREVKTKSRLDGHDVVLIYNSKFLSIEGESVSHCIHNAFSTRDILETKFKYKPTGKSFVVLANHWPSRLWSKSDSLRSALADYCNRIVGGYLKYDIDALFTKSGRVSFPSTVDLYKKWSTPVMLLGDFNDEPFDSSVRFVLGGYRDIKKIKKTPKMSNKKNKSNLRKYLNLKIHLYNPMWKFVSNKNKPRGTCYWSGQYYLLDQVLFSNGFLNEGDFKFEEESLEIFSKQNILHKGRKIKVSSRGGVPRPYDSKKMEGVSDHFPIYFNIHTLK